MIKIVGCGKELHAGDWIAERRGMILCEECNGKYHADWRVIYPVGQIAKGVTVKCGQRSDEAKFEEVKE